MGHTKRNGRHGRHHTRHNNSNGLGRGRKSNVTAAQRRRTAAKKTRERAAYRRQQNARTLRNQRKIQQMINLQERARIARYMDAMRNPYGRYGQKWDEAGFDMYD